MVSMLALLIGLGMPPTMDTNSVVKEAQSVYYSHVENVEQIKKLGFFGALAGFNAFTQSGPLISSVQTFTISVAAASATGTATVTSASTTLSSLHCNGYASDSSGSITGTNDVGYLTQTNATTITATRNGTTGTLTVEGCLITWTAAAVRQVQMGTVSITTTNTTGTATITSLTTGNSAVLWMGNSSSISGTQANSLSYLTITSATQITSTRQTGTSATVIAGFCAIEWNSGILNSSTQQATVNIPSGTSATSTITSVTTGQTWSCYGGQSMTGSASWNGQYSAFLDLTNGTTYTLTINLANVGNASVTAVEFKAANVNNVQRGHATENKSGTNTFTDVTITAVVSANTWAQYLGVSQTSSSSAVARLTLTSVRLTSTTNLRIDRGILSATVGETPSYEVFEQK